MRESILKDKSKAFALRMIRLYKYLCEEKKEYVLSKQLLRSGTSIGANIAEGIHAESNADFITKYAVAQKEASETIYWLELLHESDYLTTDGFESLQNDVVEIMKLITSTIKTMKTKQKRGKV